MALYHLLTFEGAADSMLVCFIADHAITSTMLHLSLINLGVLPSLKSILAYEFVNLVNAKCTE